MYETFTDTELLKKIDDTVKDHNNKKQTIIDLSLQIDNLGLELDSLEKQYVDLIAELNNRQENAR